MNFRRNDLTKTKKTVPLAAIKPIIQTRRGFTGTQSHLLKGGLEDMGNYAEGFCFKVNALGGEEETWIVR